MTSKSKSVHATSTTKSHAKPATHSSDSHPTAGANGTASSADAPAQLEAATTPPVAVPVQARLATITDSAKSAVSLITQAQNALPLEVNLSANARHAALKLQHVPSTAIAESARILQAEGHRFPDFDPQLALDTAAFETSINDVVSGATALIGKAKTALLQQRGPAAEQTLALYAVLKGQSRTDATLVEPAKRLEPLVNTRKNPHQTKKQREEAKAKKAAAASSSPSNPAPATASAPTAEQPAPVVPGASAPPVAGH